MKMEIIEIQKVCIYMREAAATRRQLCSVPRGDIIVSLLVEKERRRREKKGCRAAFEAEKGSD